MRWRLGGGIRLNRCVFCKATAAPRRNVLFCVRRCGLHHVRPFAESSDVCIADAAGMHLSTQQPATNEPRPGMTAPSLKSGLLESAVIPADQPVVFFDGVCGLCNHAINFLLARDTQRRLKFAPLQGTTAAAVLPEESRVRLDTLVLAHEGRLYYRSTAVVRALLLLPGGWKVVGWLLWLIPSPLRNLGYRMVSAVRYRLFGKHESCRLPSPEERRQFLD